LHDKYAPTNNETGRKAGGETDKISFGMKAFKSELVTNRRACMFCLISSLVGCRKSSSLAGEWWITSVNYRTQKRTHRLTLSEDGRFKGWFVNAVGYFEGAGTWRYQSDGIRQKVVLVFDEIPHKRASFERHLIYNGTLRDEWHGFDEFVVYER
jgi:hypothetical protein